MTLPLIGSLKYIAIKLGMFLFLTDLSSRKTSSFYLAVFVKTIILFSSLDLTIALLVVITHTVIATGEERTACR
jgi:hypothetical protein